MASSAPGVTAALRRGNARYEGFDTRKPAMASAVRSSRILRGSVSEKNALALSIGLFGIASESIASALTQRPAVPSIVPSAVPSKEESA